MKRKDDDQYILECSADAAEAMGHDFVELVEALNNALYIGKYLTQHKGTYKEDKKRIKKVLKATEDGYFVKYMNEWDFEDDE